MANLTHAKAVDNLVAGFQSDLEDIVSTARRAVIESLMARLSVQGGQIAKTKTNQRILRSVAAVFQREMRRAGYPQLVDTYVASFNGQFEFFDRVLAKLGEDIGQDLQVKFGQRDKDLFASQQVSSINLLEDVVVAAASDAQRQALFSVGGLKLSALINEVAEQFDKSIGEATTIADTAVSTFYRTIADRGYKIVERDTRGIDLRYKYAGPDDRITRPFCHRLAIESLTGTTWTREDIDGMDNNQIPNVFLTCGGFNCRHSWQGVVKVNGG